MTSAFALPPSAGVSSAGLPLGELFAQSSGSFWLPPPSSTAAPAVDATFALIYWISLFFYALITGLLILFVIRYRRRPGYEPGEAPSHNTLLEITWSVIPTVLVVIIFYHGFVGFMDLRTAPSGAYEVRVKARKWNWLFVYPNGYVDENLHVPAGTPVRLIMESEDVIHSLFIPDFRLKMDLVPGRYTRTWFAAPKPGEHELYCAEYCGTGHSDMLAKVVVHEANEFERWLEDAANFLKTMSPVEAGRELHRRRGCAQCHSVDGTARVGPSFKGIYGQTHRFTDGTEAEVEENYIRQSILEPAAKVRQGYRAQMPTYAGILKDDEIAALIAYIKSLELE